jgi:hypothetical protein
VLYTSAAFSLALSISSVPSCSYLEAYLDLVLFFFQGIPLMAIYVNLENVVGNYQVVIIS